MNAYPTCFKILALTAIIPFISQADANYLHVTFEPRKVYQVSSKTESARATCQMCQGTTL